MSARQFTGLTMPVFTAFGWAGEENALKFALAQLEQFIDALFYSLPRDLQKQFPAHGLDRGSQSAYLAVNLEPEKDLFVTFYARPLSLEVALALNHKAALGRAYKAAAAELPTFYRLLAELGPEVNLRIQQMQVDEGSGAASQYQDLVKEPIGSLTVDKTAELVERAIFLNSEEQWAMPLSLSRRFESEKIAAMGPAVIRILTDYLNSLLPLIKLLTGQARKPKGKTRPAAATKPRAKAAPAIPETTGYQLANVALEQFTFVCELRPLQIRRGFIDLTANHWPFFALSARTETRPVILNYDGHLDKKSAVWRLVPDDQARLMLSPAAQQWLEDNFNPEDRIQVSAVKLDADNIQVTLAAVD